MEAENDQTRPDVRRFAGWSVALSAGVFFLIIAEWQGYTREYTASTWDDALTFLSEEVTGSDGIFLSPGWHAIPGERLHDVLSHSGHSGRLLRMTDPSPLDVLRYPRIFVIHPQGRPVPSALSPCTPRVQGGERDVCIWTRPSDISPFDFVRELPGAAVSRISKSKQKQPCPWNGERHKCRTQKRMYDVRAHVGEVGDTRRMAIFTHPYPSGGILQLTYPHPRGKHLLFGFGNALRGVRMASGSPVRVRVLMEDQVLFEESVAIDDFEWKQTEITVPPGDSTVTTTFEVSAEDASWRHFYLDAVSY